MNICIIWKNDYPWDVRIEKFGVSLKEIGHDIYLLCSNTTKLKREEIINGMNVRRLPSVKNSWLNSLISSPFYLNPFWFNMVNQTIIHEKIDLIIVRDLPLILIGLLMKKKYHIPIILDMAENYPAMYWKRLKKGGMSTFKNWLIKNPSLIEYIEKYAANRVDHLFVVVEESAQRLISMGIEGKKISIVSNTPDLKIFVAENQIKLEKPLQIIYVGFVQEERGLDTIINSLSKIRHSGFTIKFIIIGDGDYLGQLKSLAQKNRVEDMVEFIGWVKNTLIPKFIYACDIGIIPHKKTDHTDTTIPNKLFDFMACGKPVIVSNTNPMKRIVEEEKCGLVFRSEDEEDFSMTIKKVIDTPAMLLEMGVNGQKAVKRRYNWGFDSITLEQVIEKFKCPTNI